MEKIITLRLVAEDATEMEAMIYDVLELTEQLTTGKTQCTVEDCIGESL